MVYRPQPIDTTGVELPPEVAEIAELLARDAHDRWAAQRLADGWRPGPRDAEARTHPLLVAFEELPESEKVFDRIAAVGTLQALVASGFEIRPRTALQVEGDGAQAPRQHPAEIAARAERLLRAGEPLLAHDLLRSTLEQWPHELRLRQLLGLALARAGATYRARTVLQRLLEEGHRDGETLGLLARTYKDEALATTDPDRRRASLRRAHELYRLGFQCGRDQRRPRDAAYAGVNAATTAFLLGEREVAAALAEEVEAQCLLDETAGSEADEWALATRAECRLIRQDLEGAERALRRFASLAGHRYADLATTRRNARLLFEAQGRDASVLDDWLAVPPVAVFWGRAAPAELGADDESPVVATMRGAIRRELREVAPCAALSSVTDEAGLLFVEEVNELGADCHVVLTLPAESLTPGSNAGSGAAWLERLRRALSRAPRVQVINELSRRASSLHVDYTQRILTGLALLHARALDTELVAISTPPSRSDPAAASIARLWRDLGLRCRELCLDGRGATAAPPDDSELEAVDPRLVVRSLLFADVVGYSKLREEEVPLFVERFMGGVGAVLESGRFEAESVNTWGDAIYAAFADSETAGRCALELIEFVRSRDWQGEGFSRPLDLRIGLHTGPCYRMSDPLTKSPTFTGVHVSRAARIEPITPPGEVYASEAFAADAAASRAPGFLCEYVGSVPMAKGYGVFPTYHVSRAADRR